MVLLLNNFINIRFTESLMMLNQTLADLEDRSKIFGARVMSLVSLSRSNVSYGPCGFAVN